MVVVLSRLHQIIAYKFRAIALQVDALNRSSIVKFTIAY